MPNPLLIRPPPPWIHLSHGIPNEKKLTASSGVWSLFTTPRVRIYTWRGMWGSYCLPSYHWSLSLSLPLSIDEPVSSCSSGGKLWLILATKTLTALVSPHRIGSSRFFQTRLSHPPRIIAFVRSVSMQGKDLHVQDKYSSWPLSGWKRELALRKLLNDCMGEWWEVGMTLVVGFLFASLIQPSKENLG